MVAAASADKDKAQESVAHAQLEWQDAVMLFSLPVQEYKDYLVASCTLPNDAFEDLRVQTLQDVNQKLQDARTSLEQAIRKEKDAVVAAQAEERTFREALIDAGIQEVDLDARDIDSEAFWKLFLQMPTYVTMTDPVNGARQAEDHTSMLFF
jgi:Tfp pilus assembly PilM family ATPase